MLAPGMWLVAAGLLLLARSLLYRLEAGSGRFVRVYGIAMGGAAGLALGLVAATLLNPWMGLVPGSFHNLALFAICLGFLGLCTGALGGLLYAGMTLADGTRIDEGEDASSWEGVLAAAQGSDRPDSLAAPYAGKPVDDAGRGLRSAAEQEEE